MFSVWCKFRRRNAFKLAAAYVFLSLGALFSSSVYGQSTLEEVVVTARFRAESLQDVPLSLTVISSETIDSIGAYRMHDLNGMRLKTSGILSFVDEFFTEADLDPIVLQPSFKKIDLQIGVSSAND